MPIPRLRVVYADWEVPVFVHVGRSGVHNSGGLLYVQVDMTAYGRSVSAFVSLSRTVYNMRDLRRPDGVAKMYAQAGEEGTCIVNGWVSLTQSGYYAVWAMPSPQAVRMLRYG